MRKKFREKKYPEKIISNAYHKAGILTQGDCLVPKKKENTEINNKFRSSFITTLNFQHHKICGILQKHWHILLNDPHLQKCIPPNPPIIYRRAKTLKNKLAPSEFKESKTVATHPAQSANRGSFKYNKNRCKCCNNISNKVSTITSTCTQETFPITTHLDCEV